MINKRVIATCLTALLGLALAAVTTGFAAEPPVLVLNDVNAPPNTNAEQTGYLDVIATEAFRRAGLKLKLVKLPAERALRLANDGSLDGDLTRIAGMETLYPNLVPVPEKLVDWNFVAFSKNAAIPANFAALRGHQIGLIRGWKIYENAMAGAEHVIAVDDAAQLFHLLELDHTEAVLYTQRAGLALLKKQGIKNVRVLQPLLSRQAMFIYLNKRHAKLAPRIAAALRELRREGFYDRVYREKPPPHAPEATP